MNGARLLTAAALITMAVGCGSAAPAADSPADAPSTSATEGAPDLMRLQEIPVTEPVSFNAGRAQLTAAPPTTVPGVTADKPLAEFVRFLGDAERGKTVEARFGLYSDSSQGTASGGSFVPSPGGRAVWVLVVRNTIVLPAGPAGVERQPPRADHDTVGVFDGTTGELIVVIEEAAIHPA